MGRKSKVKKSPELFVYKCNVSRQINSRFKSRQIER